MKQNISPKEPVLIPDDNGVYITRCNNCWTYLIDHNPQVNAVRYHPSAITGEVILLKPNKDDEDFGTPVEHVDSEGCFYGCPHCLTDGYLNDI